MNDSVTIIDQQTRRRIVRTGLTALDEKRACPGYVLYAPLFGPGDAYLLDIKGNEVHKWDMPYAPGLYCYLLPNGNLFYLGKLQEDVEERFPRWDRYRGGIMLEADWDGNVLWEYRDRDQHHDAGRTESGGVIYLSIEKVPEDLAARVKGGRRLPNGNTLITEGLFGRMFQVTPEGEVVWEYINPYFPEDSNGALNNAVFRATHYTADEIHGLQ